MSVYNYHGYFAYNFGESDAPVRPYLLGGRFSAADLSLAALAAPLLLPRAYGAPLPTLAELPAELLPLIDELRSSPAGEFGLRLYRDHR